MRKHGRKEKIRYQPIPVREILLEMKNLSEIMIDLAYSAALFGDKDLAEDVIELEERIDLLTYLLNMEVMLATRDAEDAKVLSGVAKVASAADKISDAAGDIANIVLHDIGVHPIISNIFERVEERLARIKILENSPIIGMKISSLDPASMGIDIIAIRRGGDWIINPREEEIIKSNDIIIVRGVQEGINEFREKVGERIIRGEEEIIRKIVWEDRFKDVIERFVELKDVSEVMIDLAYSALMLNSKELAEEVQRLEEYVDRLHTEFELLVLSSKFVESEVKGILGLIRLGVAAEKISDAAAEIAEIILRGIDPHPILRMTVESAEETVIYAQVNLDSTIVNKTLREARIPEETGMWILAIKRGDKIIRPKPDTRIEANDVIIAAGYSQGKEDFINLVSYKKEE
ncbi:MAG: TrkA C-terminal domain-containing protein [Candidatus Bathyarchaeia archaeon]